MYQANDEDVSCRSRKQDFTCTGPCTVRTFLSISARFSLLHDERRELGLLFTHSKKWNAEWTWRTQPWPQIARRDCTDSGHWIWAMKLAAGVAIRLHIASLVTAGNKSRETHDHAKRVNVDRSACATVNVFSRAIAKSVIAYRHRHLWERKRVWPIVERLKTFVPPCQVISHPINFLSVASLFVPQKSWAISRKTVRVLTFGSQMITSTRSARRSAKERTEKFWHQRAPTAKRQVNLEVLALSTWKKTIFRSLGPQRPLGSKSIFPKRFPWSIITMDEAIVALSPIARQPKDSCWKLRWKHELAAHESVLKMESDASFLLFCTIWTVIFVHESRQLWRWVWCIGLQFWLIFSPNHHLLLSLSSMQVALKFVDKKRIKFWTEVSALEPMNVSGISLIALDGFSVVWFEWRFLWVSHGVFFFLAKQWTCSTCDGASTQIDVWFTRLQ